MSDGIDYLADELAEIKALLVRLTAAVERLAPAPRIQEQRADSLTRETDLDFGYAEHGELHRPG